MSHRLFPYGTLVEHEIEENDLAQRLNVDIDLRDDLKEAILKKLGRAKLDFDITIWDGNVSVAVDLGDVLSKLIYAVDDFTFDLKHDYDEEKEIWILKESEDED